MTVLAIAVGLWEEERQLRLYAAVFAAGGVYYVAVAVRARFAITKDVLVIRSTFRTAVVPLRAIEVVRIEAYDGGLSWGLPSRVLSMITVVTADRQYRCRLTVSPRRYCRRRVIALREAVARAMA